MSNLEFLSLESSLSFLNRLLDISILLIVIGLILEFAPKAWSKFFGGAPHKRVEKLGEVLVILGVAGELALHIRSEQVEDKIKTAQRGEIIALQKKLAPRELTKDQLAALSEVAKHFTGQQYWLSVAPGAEPAALMCSIKKLLNEAGWIRIKDLGTSLRIDAFCGDGEQIGVNFASYVRLWINPDAPESTQKAHAELTGAFEAAAIDVFPHKEPNVVMDKAAIHVMIGAKL
jgi:hypothetical protein